ncbi:hypothetical protein ACET3Z_032308 [Daucus carota]
MGEFKHILVVKFREDTTPQEIESLIKGFANLVSLVPTMKSFHWGKDVSTENLHQGFTHVFESTFDSLEGIAEYGAHPHHVEFANIFVPKLEKVIVIDYKPTVVHP